MHIFQCMGKIYCVEFQRVPLKFHSKYLTHVLEDMICEQCWNFIRFKSSCTFCNCPLIYSFHLCHHHTESNIMPYCQFTMQSYTYINSKRTCLLILIWMAWCKTVKLVYQLWIYHPLCTICHMDSFFQDYMVSPVLIHWGYYILALSYPYDVWHIGGVAIDHVTTVDCSHKAPTHWPTQDPPPPVTQCWAGPGIIRAGMMKGMKTSWHWNDFCITGPLWGESIK